MLMYLSFKAEKKKSEKWSFSTSTYSSSNKQVEQKKE